MKLVSRVAKLLLLLGLVLSLFSGGTVYFWWQTVSGAADVEDHQKIKVEIPKGASATEVGRLLSQSGVIRDPFVFRAASRLRKKSAAIMPGEYTLSKSLTIDQIYEQLEKGPTDLRLTIPEGWRREQIAVRLGDLVNNRKSGKFDNGTFLAITKGLEGKLFPDTYLVPQDASEDTIVKMMLLNFQKKTEKLLDAQLPAGLNKEGVIVLSSIVERETSGNENERAIVAGILLKRLKNNWPLQTDATLQYIRDSLIVAKGTVGIKFWQPLTGAEKEIDSPYNTYLYQGIPPMAIANPGLSAIKAVLSPQDTAYWYYIHGDDGKIHFAQTSNEHQQNITKYLSG